MYEELIKNAKLLLSDNGENLEYDRAIIELIHYTTGKEFSEILHDVQAHINIYNHLGENT